MELSVKTLDSQTHVFKDLDEEMLVSQLKSHISTAVALVPEQQRLIFRGRVLQDDKKLKDYNLTSGQVIHLVARNPNTGSSANDHPQPANTVGGGAGAMGHNIIMGHIGTLEFPDAGSMGGQRSNARPVSPAVIRLTVANQSLRQASELLRSLEEDITVIQPPERSRGTEEPNVSVIMVGSSPAVAGAAVVTSIHPAQSPDTTGTQVQERDVNPTTTTERGPQAAVNGAESSNAGPSNLEAPMCREFGAALNDLIVFNTRLAPYLMAQQRWLSGDGEFGFEAISVQYTFETISSILHTLSHSIHALSDLTIDFSRDPAERRVRAPSLLRIEQSPVIRATIPIGVHVEMDSGANNLNPNNGQRQPSQAMGAQTDAAQFQQAISNLIQGMVTGQGQIQNPGAGPDPRNNAVYPQVQAMMGNQWGNLFGGNGVQISANTVTNSGNTSAASTNQNNPAPPGIGTQSANPPQQQHLLRNIRSFVGGRTAENMLLQCQSHHYHAVRGPRPPTLNDFLSQELETQPEPHTEVFETFVSFLQAVNTLHPILNQYIRGNILRGRDINNPDHIKTGVRVYARKLVEWIVASISRTADIDSAALNLRLSSIVTDFMAKVAQTILTAAPRSRITPNLAAILNESMPALLEVLQQTFPSPGHTRVFKGIILMLVATCFPGASVVFTTQLATGIAEYLMVCRPSPPPEYHLHHISTEVSMEIDVEIGEMMDSGSGDDLRDQQQNSREPAPYSINSTSSVNSNANAHDRQIPETVSDSEEDLDAEIRAMTDDLFRNVPQVWQNTLLNDIQRQAPLREFGDHHGHLFSAGFLSLFPHK